MPTMKKALLDFYLKQKIMIVIILIIGKQIVIKKMVIIQVFANKSNRFKALNPMAFKR